MRLEYGPSIRVYALISNEMVLMLGHGLQAKFLALKLKAFKSNVLVLSSKPRQVSSTVTQKFSAEEIKPLYNVLCSEIKSGDMQIILI